MKKGSLTVPFHRPYITDTAIQSVVDSLRSGWTTMGKKTVQFEEEFARYLGMPHAVAVNSGTAALHCALVAIGIGEGDEVIVPATTFVATSEVVEYCGARPVLVDVERDTHCINPEKIIEHISSKTGAIIPVHFSGHPCDMDAINDIAEQHGITVCEDAAHALPSVYKGRKIGTTSSITCFSFYATKTLSTGEGGMVVTGNDRWAESIRVMRLHGMNRDAWKRYSAGASWEYDIITRGYKYNTTDINAALGIDQLHQLEWMLERRKEIAERYNSAFSGEDALIPYVTRSDVESAWHLYPLKLNVDVLTITRDRFIQMLYERGVSASVHFIPLYRFTCFKDKGFSSERFPDSEWVYEREVSLPIFPGMTGQEIEHVVDSVIDIVRTSRR